VSPYLRVLLFMWCCGIAHVPNPRPSQAEFGGVTQHVVAVGALSGFNPGYEIVKCRLTLGVASGTMPGRAQRALHQQLRRASPLGTAPVVLFQPERDAEIPGFVQRHDGRCDLASQFGEDRIGQGVGIGCDALDVPVERRCIDPKARIDVVLDGARVGVTREKLRLVRAGILALPPRATPAGGEGRVEHQAKASG
jgi:hypothetical protein